MTDTYRNPLGQYRTVDAYGAAAAGNRVQLISRLLAGAMDRLVTARGHMVRRELAAKGEHLNRAVGIIEGLRVSLDHGQGGEIARNLEALYDYMVRRLTIANLRNEPQALDEVVELLGELRSGWDEMSRHVSAQVSPQVGPQVGGEPAGTAPAREPA